MWNEYMEWVDEWDNPIPIPDEEDDDERDPQWEDSQPKQTSNSLEKYEVIGLAAIISTAGLVGTAIGNHIKKKKEQENANKTHAATEWVRANIKDHKQETAETLQSNGNYWEVSRRKTNSKITET